MTQATSFSIRDVATSIVGGRAKIEATLETLFGRETLEILSRPGGLKFTLFGTPMTVAYDGPSQDEITWNHVRGTVNAAIARQLETRTAS